MRRKNEYGWMTEEKYKCSPRWEKRSGRPDSKWKIYVKKVLGEKELKQKS